MGLFLFLNLMKYLGSGPLPSDGDYYDHDLAVSMIAEMQIVFSLKITFSFYLQW